MKSCSKCKESKELSEFHVRSASKDGRESKCIECTSTSTKSKYIKNRAEKLEKSNLYQQKNKKKVSAYKAKWYHFNLPSVTKTRLHNQKHKPSPEKKREQNLKYNEENKEQIKEDKATWYQKNRYILKFKKLMK